MNHKKKNYKKIVQLCSDDSPSTSAVVCFDGMVKLGDGAKGRRTFIEIKSCHDIIRLFKYENDSWPEFAAKLRKLGETCLNFWDYCSQETNQKKFEEYDDYDI